MHQISGFRDGSVRFFSGSVPKVDDIIYGPGPGGTHIAYKVYVISWIAQDLPTDSTVDLAELQAKITVIPLW